jgi:hypothetical protein
MEALDGVPLSTLADVVCTLVHECLDKDLLDLVYRILAQSASTVLPG